MLATFVADTVDQSWVPWNWRGRNGLTLMETLWDTDVFWGEIWFNIMVICIFSAVILIRFPPKNQAAWKFTLNQQKSIFLFALGISCAIPIAMLLAEPIQVDILQNWYSTQFGYQIMAWPIIIGLICIFIFRIKTAATENQPPKILIMSLLMLFAGIWIYLTTITDFHPHVLIYILIYI